MRGNLRQMWERFSTATGFISTDTGAFFDSSGYVFRVFSTNMGYFRQIWVFYKSTEDSGFGKSTSSYISALFDKSVYFWFDKTAC